MPDTLFMIRGTNGGIYVDPDRLMITKETLVDIPLDQVAAVQFHEGKLLQDGYILVTTKREEDRFILETMKNNEKAVMISRKDSAKARNFCDQVEEYIYSRFYE